MCRAAVAAAAAAVLFPPLLFAQPETSTENLLNRFYELEDATEPLEVDTNDDGSKDYYARTNEAGEKMMEVLDFNHDGKVDDFYFYRRGVLQKRAVDSNYDEKIDLWVYIAGGVYISEYLRDGDYDGTFETKKSFEAEEKAAGEREKPDDRSRAGGTNGGMSGGSNGSNGSTEKSDGKGVELPGISNKGADDG
jgi:hypothetical protein